MDSWKRRWGFEQWAAFFETQQLPVTPKSKQMLLDLEANKGELLSPKELDAIVLADPLLCLRLLREAEKSKTSHLKHETTTSLSAILQLGVERFRDLLMSSCEVDETNLGLMEVEARAALASRIALNWSSARMDVNPEEIAVSALLADTGELLLWVYAPELPEAAKGAMRIGAATRSAAAQSQTCGFDFKSLTVRCTELWNLPQLLRLLLRGSETPRAQLSRVCTNASRHLIETHATSFQALAQDIADAHKLMPSAPLDWMVDGLIFVPPDRKPELVARAEELIAHAAV